MTRKVAGLESIMPPEESYVVKIKPEKSAVDKGFLKFDIVKFTT